MGNFEVDLELILLIQFQQKNTLICMGNGGKC